MAPLIIAFAMYSKIPMPRVDWNSKNMKYAMCFFPVIGLVIGAVEIGAWYLMHVLGMSEWFRAVVLVLIPIAVTGGIHMDGFMDTTDAISSHAERERKLEILKDSHTGAFAILGCVVYFLLAVAVWTEITEKSLLIACPGFVLSRALSGFAVVTFRSARKNGLLYTFADGAHRKVVRGTLVLFALAAAAAMVVADAILGVVGILIALLVFAYYRWYSYKEFGGITGDLAGWFLQLCELAIPLVLVLAERMIYG